MWDAIIPPNFNGGLTKLSALMNHCTHHILRVHLFIHIPDIYDASPLIETWHAFVPVFHEVRF